MATYKSDQQVEVRTFLPPPEWGPAVIQCQASDGMYQVEWTFPGGHKATAMRRADEIRPVKGDGDAT